MNVTDEIKRRLWPHEELAALILGRAIKREVAVMFNLTGWKTKAGGVGLMLGGAAGLFAALACAVASFTAENGTGFTGAMACWQEGAAGVAAIGAGLGVLGIGHKVEKAATGQLQKEVAAKS